MFTKFCIVLFITIFCNGVAYSSPLKGNSSELISREQITATEPVTHINHKIELNNTAPDAGLHHIENPALNISAKDSKIEEKPTSNSTNVEKVINQGLDTKSDNKTATDATSKSPNATSKSPNATNKSPNATISGPVSNGTKPIAPTPAAVPVTSINTVTDLPPRTMSDMSRPIVPGQNNTVTTLAPGTTTKAPATTPTVVTPTPAPAVSTTMNNVILVHDSSTKPQENRFDGASFVGGIVLTIGLTAIGFIAFKYYKSGYY